MVAGVGWVERSETHQDSGEVKPNDGFRYALPILQGSVPFFIIHKSRLRNSQAARGSVMAEMISRGIRSCTTISKPTPSR